MIRLQTFENNSFKTIKNISEESFASLKFDSEILKESYTQFVVFKYLQLNIKDYSKFIRESSNIPAVNLNVNYLMNNEVVLEVNKLIFNILISFKFFLDNAEKYLKRKYGKESEIAINYLTLKSHYFDNVFAYRFLSKLRDYTIHLGFPLQALSYEVTKKTENLSEISGDIQLLVDVELLKKEKDTFGRIVHNDLLKIEEDIDLRPLIQELSKIIIEIQKHIYRIQKEEIENSIENIETFVGNHKTENNEIKVFYNLINEEIKAEFNTYDIPFDIIEEYNKICKNWS